jgi:hypothetical protein
MNLANSIWGLLLSIMLFTSCAKQTSPTGGPKDTIPPVLAKVIPPNESVNFKGKTIELEFSEMIITNNPKEQLIITPSIGKDFQVKAKKKSVVVSFESDLQDSTTYSFNFRDAVQDITEKNSVRNLTLAFSTGSYLDSLSIRGKITDLLKGKEVKDATVAIHAKSDTFSIFKHPATFFTKADAKGNFIIDHLKPDEYYIYAIEDKNKNLIADSRNESYGFLQNPIHLTRDTAGIEVGLVKLDARPLKITSTRPYNTYFNIRTTKNVKEFTITETDSAKLYYSFGEDHANIRIYNSLTNQDSLAINLHAIDSINNSIDTTLYIKFNTREVEPEKFSLSLSATNIIADKGELNGIITFTKPIQTVNFDSIVFRPDSSTTIQLTKNDLKWEPPTNKLIIRKTLDKKLFAPKEPPITSSTNKTDSLPSSQTKNTPPKSTSTPKKEISNQLYLGTGAFISIEHDTSKVTTQNINPSKTEDLSKIIYNIGTSVQHYLVQLVDPNLNLLKQFKDKPKGEFTDLTPGEYILRVIIDSNNNNEWDPGNYLNNEQPENIIYQKDEKGSRTINLKANWDFETAPMLISQ